MHFYALHIKTGFETQIQKFIIEKMPDDVSVFCPMRELLIRKNGKTKKETKPLFPGYIFLKTEEVNAGILSSLKSIPGFFQVLPSNKNIKPIRQQDMHFLDSLFNKNYTAHLSKARFDENDKIQIIEGPLKGKEGLIIKVDKRKGRAKIVINAFDKQHFVDLGFEVISTVTP
ncbi:MAG: antiterminator LoaP [Spirochaetaceae bacterium]|jgi:transcriptional antiterminator NusG|nr:antiterminator LoaP [Spirochaetaceae bacterium]